MFLQVARSLSAERNLAPLLDQIVHATTRVMRADRSTIFLLDAQRRELWSLIAEGLGNREIRIPADRGVAGWVASHGEALIIPDAYADQRFHPLVDKQTGYKTRSILCVPLRNNQGDLTGVLQVLNKREGTFDDYDLELLTGFASFCAITIENSDIYTRLTRSYEELKKLDRMKDAFLSLVTHELKTPLSQIYGAAELLRSGELEGVEKSEYLRGIHEESQRLTRMIDTLTDLLRLESGTQPYRKEAQEVDDVLLQAASVAEPRAAQAGVELAVECGCAGAVLELDLERLVRALLEVIDNALRFSPPNGKVLLSSRVVDDEYRIVVEDQGPGIPEEHLTRVFDKFSQVTDVDYHTEGLGLGLPIARHIVERGHQGRIWAENLNGGGGTRVVLSLPKGREVLG